MKFNINNPVKVRLTTVGLKRHYDLWKDFHDAYPHFDYFKEYSPPKLDAYGYYSSSLWSIMNDYGDLCYMGGQIPFNTEIIIGD